MSKIIICLCLQNRSHRLISVTTLIAAIILSDNITGVKYIVGQFVDRKTKRQKNRNTRIIMFSKSTH